MIDSARRLFHPTTIMAFQQLLELTPSTLFVAGTVLHVKIEPLDPGNAILLTGPARGTAATFADTAFVDAVAPRKPRVLATSWTGPEDRARRTSSPTTSRAPLARTTS